jgi:hypothetical protein
MLLVGALGFDQGTARLLGFVRFRGTSSRRSG